MSSEYASELHLKSASTINEINVVQSHISKLKGYATSSKTENC